MNRASERSVGSGVRAPAVTAPGRLRLSATAAMLLGLTAVLFLGASCAPKPKTPGPAIITVAPLVMPTRDAFSTPTPWPAQILPVTGTTTPLLAQAPRLTASPTTARTALPPATARPAQTSTPSATPRPVQTVSPPATPRPDQTAVPTVNLLPTPTAASPAAPTLAVTTVPPATPLPEPTTDGPPPATPDAPSTPSPDAPCGEPSLALGALQFRVRSLAPARDGSIVVPAKIPDVAYWVQGTGFHYLFALSPTEANLRLQEMIRISDQAVITWADCRTDAFQVQAVEASVPPHAELLRRSTDGLTVFVQAGVAGQGVLLRAGR